MKKITVTSLSMLFFIMGALNIYSDLGPIDVIHGGNVIMVNNEDIALDHEVITIDLYNDYYAVNVDYVFVNQGKAQHVIMGFPNETSPPIGSEKYVEDYAERVVEINNFKAYESGKALNVFRKKDNSEPQGKRWYYTQQYYECIKLYFKKDETKRIINIYTQKYYNSYSSERSAVYILKTGKKWKGPIHSVKVNINFKLNPTEYMPRTVVSSQAHLLNGGYGENVEIKPKATYIAKDKAVIELKNVDPDFDIEIWLPYNLCKSAYERRNNKEEVESPVIALIDADLSTAWISSELNNESVTIDIAPVIAKYFSGSYLVKKIGIVNGNAKDKNTFIRYSRAKKIQVDLEYIISDFSNLNSSRNSKQIMKKIFEFTLSDTMEMQYLEFPFPVLISRFTIKILEKYEGTIHKNTALSEVLVYPYYNK